MTVSQTTMNPPPISGRWEFRSYNTSTTFPRQKDLVYPQFFASTLFLIARENGKIHATMENDDYLVNLQGEFVQQGSDCIRLIGHCTIDSTPWVFDLLGVYSCSGNPHEPTPDIQNQETSKRLPNHVPAYEYMAGSMVRTQPDSLISIVDTWEASRQTTRMSTT